MLQRLAKFLESGIWRIRLRDLPRPQMLILRPLRILVLALRGFDEDKCGFRASALTYYSLLSIVPVLALAFGIAKGFNLDERLRELIRASVLGNNGTIETVVSSDRLSEAAPEHVDAAAPARDAEPPAVEGHAPEPGSAAAAPTAAAEAADAAPVDYREAVVDRLIEFSDSFLQNARGDVIAGVGVVFLFWVVVRVLGSIEDSFNEIWGIHRGRSLARRVSEYLSLLLICPVFLITASSMTVRIRAFVQSMAGTNVFLDPLARVLLFGLQLLPYAMIWVLFGFIYMLMPNTRVSLKAAAVGGIIAGTLFHVVQWAYIHFQVGVARNNAIYGSFAALPLFLVWVNLSWVVVLLGAEIAFSVDNEETYEFENDARNASHRLRRLLALRIVQEVARRFETGDTLPTAPDLSHLLEAPIRLVRDTMHELAEAGLLSETVDGDTPTERFQPARPLDALTIQNVTLTLDQRGSSHPGMIRSEELQILRERLDAIDRRIEEAPENARLTEI